MPAILKKLLSPEEEELQRKKALLAQLEAQLADRELELAALLADLHHFEQHYLRTVGQRYALLDELKAQLAETQARRNPHNDTASDEARKAREQAQDSARAVGDQPDESASQPKPARSESLDKLYRQAARLLHPDLTLDPEEKKKRHDLMAEINDAYARGDEERIRAILREWHTAPESVHGDGPGAELVRIIRKIAQVEKRLTIIATELDRAREGESLRQRSPLL
jgi:hypothetical protein